MRFIILLIITIAFVSKGFGQITQPKLRQYWDLNNMGDDYLYHFKDTTNALLFYDSAFNFFVTNFGSPFCGLPIDLIRLHAIKGNSKKVYAYIKHGILVNHFNDKPEYYTLETWGKQDKYNVFRNSEYWNLFVKEYDSLYRAATSMLNWELLSEYLSIAKIDQIVRRDELTRTKQLCIDSGYDNGKIGWALIGDFDKINLLKVINLIKENGFLEYSETGGKIGIYNFVLLHSFSSCNRDPSVKWAYDFLDSLILNNVLSGKYPPSLYAAFKDRSYAYSCEVPQRYGNWSGQIRGGTREILYGLQDIENVDKLRYEIFLPPLYIQSLKDGFKLPDGYKIPNKYK